MALIFFGSSEFSLSAFKACLDGPFKVSLVVTTPDRKQGRGLKELPTPVKQFALEKGLPVISPESLKPEDILEKARTLAPDYFVVSSYGKMIPNSWLALPSKLALNVHPSLLPKYRGAAPMNWPILNGDAETGMSIAEVTSKLDAGDLFYQKHIPILREDTSETLASKLAEMSYHALLEVFSQIQTGKLSRKVQDDSFTNYARKLTKEDGRIDWNQTAEKIFNQVRGLLPWPAAYAVFQGEIVQILKAGYEDSGASSAPGAVLECSRMLKIQTGKGLVIVERVKPAGKKEMSGADYARGKRILKGMILTTAAT